jgi:hypothetical protein
MASIYPIKAYTAGFSVEELRYLAEMLDGRNDPGSQSALEKINMRVQTLLQANLG